MFSLIIVIYNEYEKVSLIGIKKFRKLLDDFENDIPETYSLAAKEGVNNKKERIIRNSYLVKIINDNNHNKT